MTKITKSSIDNQFTLLVDFLPAKNVKMKFRFIQLLDIFHLNPTIAFAPCMGA